MSLLFFKDWNFWVPRFLRTVSFLLLRLLSASVFEYCGFLSTTVIKCCGYWLFWFMSNAVLSITIFEFCGFLRIAVFLVLRFIKNCSNYLVLRFVSIAVFEYFGFWVLRKLSDTVCSVWGSGGESEYINIKDDLPKLGTHPPPSTNVHMKYIILYRVSTKFFFMAWFRYFERTVFFANIVFQHLN